MFRHSTSAVVGAALILVTGATASKADAQVSPGEETSPPCAREPIRCPPHAAISNWMIINLKRSGSTCVIEPRQVPELYVPLGGDVRWDFCNECPVDIKVTLSTVSGGPFNDFDIVMPFPSSDNEVSTTVRCHDYSSIYGLRAKTEGDHKYSITAATGPGGPSDVIDPRLEIDDPSGFWPRRLTLVLVGGLALLLGLLMGRWMTGRRSPAT